MDHPSDEQWMQYLYGELDKASQSGLQTHLEGCAQCRAAVGRWRRVMGELDAWKLSDQRPHKAPLLRWAAAAVLVLAIGFGLGRLFAGARLDAEELHYRLQASLEASLEPVLRQQLAEELESRWQAGLANARARIEEDLREQFRADTAEVVRALAESDDLTNRRLSRFAELYLATRARDREAINAALVQLESRWLADTSVLRNGLVTLAAATGDELLQTRRDMILLYNQAQPAVPEGQEERRTQ